MIDFTPDDGFNLENYYEALEEIGTSIQVGEGDGMYRMHIHVPTDNRYTPIDYTMGLGTIQKVAIENLLAQMDEKKNKKNPKIKLAQVHPEEIAVVCRFSRLGADPNFCQPGRGQAIIQGGQTMNPSIKEIMAAF